MRISDWSSDVCSSDLTVAQTEEQPLALFHLGKQPGGQHHAVAIGGAAVLERDAMHHRIAVEPVIAPALRPIEIGRASCRERVCQYVSISVVAVSFKKTIK